MTGLRSLLLLGLLVFGLDLANELRLGDRASGCLGAFGRLDLFLDDGTAADLREKFFDFAAVDRQGLRLTAVAVDDRGNFAGLAKLARETFPFGGPGSRAQ